MNVLLATMDMSLARMICPRIVNRGHLAIMANSVKEADELIRRHQVNLAIICLQLPDGNPLALIEKIKQYNPATPIVVMTATNTRSLELSIRKLGITYYMVAPISVEEIESILVYLSARSTITD